MKLPWTTLSPRARQVLSAAALVTGVAAVGHELSGRAPREVSLHADLRALSQQGFAPRSLRVELVDDDGVVLRRVERRAPPGGSLQVVRAPVTLPSGAWHVHIEVTGDARVLTRDVTLQIEAGHDVDLPVPQP